MHIRKIAFAAVVAALYAALTLAIAPIAFGPVQFRIAEALCILPFFYPVTSLGLFVGCLIANLLSPYGILDIFAGSLATLLAAACTMWIGRANRAGLLNKAIACLPPVLFNALIIGAVIAWSEVGAGESFRLAFAVNGLQVGVGQLVVLYAIGFPLMIYLPRTRVFTFLSKTFT